MRLNTFLVIILLLTISCSKTEIEVDYPDFQCKYCTQNNSLLTKISNDFYLLLRENKVVLLDDKKRVVPEEKVGEVVFNLIKEKERVFREIDLHVNKSIKMQLVDSIVKEFRRAGVVKVNYHIKNNEFLSIRFNSYSCSDRYNLPFEFSKILKEFDYESYKKRYYNYEHSLGDFPRVEYPYELSAFGFEEECSGNGVISCGPPPEKDYVKVFFQGKNQLILNNIELNKKSLLDSIDFFVKNRKLVVHEYSRDLTYGDFIFYKVYYSNQIQNSRDSISTLLYDLDYKSLNKEKRNETKKAYPLQFFSYKNQNRYKDIFIPDSVLMKKISKQKELIN